LKLPRPDGGANRSIANGLDDLVETSPPAAPIAAPDPAT
jgi:hypothetical protein